MPWSWLLLAAAVAGADGLAEAVRAGTLPGTTSVLAIQGGKVVHEAYFEGTDAATLQDPRSVGKSITALAVGIAVGDQKLALEDPAFKYLAHLRPFANDGPAKADKGKDAITIADLLTMSSALDCDDDEGKSPGNELKMYPTRHWARFTVDLPIKAGYQRDARGRGPFAYCTAGTHLLGQILERATGERVDRYIQRRLFAPLGIEKSQWRRSPSDEVLTGGQLRLRTRDLGALGRLVLAGGRWNGKRVVPEAFVTAAITPQLKPNRASDPEGKLDYGYLFWRRDYQTPCGRVSGWYMSGNGGNHVTIVPALDAVLVVTATNYNQGGKMHRQSFEIMERHLFPRLKCK